MYKSKRRHEKFLVNSRLYIIINIASYKEIFIIILSVINISLIILYLFLYGLSCLVLLAIVTVPSSVPRRGATSVSFPDPTTAWGGARVWERDHCLPSGH